MPGERRLDQIPRRSLIALRPQQICKIDQSFEACRFQRQHPAEKRLRWPGQPEYTRSVAKREQHAHVVGTPGQRTLEFTDCLGVTGLRRKRQAVFIGIALRGWHGRCSHEGR